MNFKRILILLVVLIILSCTGYYFATMKDSQRIQKLKRSGALENLEVNYKDSTQRIPPESKQEVNDAKEWLTKTIEEFYEQSSTQNFQDITTKQYARYKQDALCVVYECDSSLTEEQFKQKWNKVYDISYAGLGESFLIGKQDWGKITMSKCELISVSKEGNFDFETVIEDTSSKVTFQIAIIVEKTSDGFKIGDVKKRK